ncbi:MAG TPA: VacJ family lipoprotein [Phenylobacterium sp.]|uniref:MlaA family lipoprotein n=1 Tax=Phenylobacterium sp. TaxID=1871053 RepID=UPI002D70FA42|nr:VacJ family lipoprotein [Phenylobacterium sp.]HZZ69564.1 VacJ family lipoprotein [Phenylobacterium sp.]
MPLAWPLIVAVAFVGPCRAAAPGDPFEGFNRKMFGIEESLDRHLFGPVSKGYRSAPSTIRTALRNWARNVGEPVVFVNDVLQGRIGTAAGTLTRFVVNSTFGVAGFIDVAKKNHLPRHDNSFGTTLGRWGVGPGPYLFLPLIGPTTVRDGIGNIADIGLDPFNYVRFDGRTEIEIASTVIEGLSDRVEGAEDLERIRQTSTDPYATLRSYFLQNRQAEVTGKPVDIDTLPDFDTAPPKAAPSPTPATATQPATPPSATDSSAAAADTTATVDGAPDAAPDDSAGEDPAA